MAHVLVYAGAGTSSSSVRWTLQALRDALPLYDVHTVTAAALALPSWRGSTALLVLPGGRDLPYVADLGRERSHAEGVSTEGSAGGSSSSSSSNSSTPDAQVSAYVRSGGAFLGICAGAYYASARCEFEVGTPLEVVGARPLSFYNGTCCGAVFRGFSYDGAGAASRDVRLDSPPELANAPVWVANHEGGGAFFGDPNAEILARYPAAATTSLHPHSTLEPHPDTDSGSIPVTHVPPPYMGQAAIVLCRVEQGKAILSGVHPERPLADAPAEAARRRVFACLLTRLGLRVHMPGQEDTAATPGTKANEPPHLTPLVLVHCGHGSGTESESAGDDGWDDALVALGGRRGEGGSGREEPTTLVLAHDTFIVHRGAEGLREAAAACAAEDYSVYREVLEDGSRGEVDLRRVPKHLVICPPNASLAGAGLPFDVHAAAVHLHRARAEITAHPLVQPTWDPFNPVATAHSVRLAPSILYGQAVTSTQTLLDKNPELLRVAPDGLVFVATHQVAGRGRGGNRWISPRGCLQFSFVCSLPLVKAQESVFVQYLAGLALVLCIPRLGPGYDALHGKVRIKWPNDVYAEIGEARARAAGAGADAAAAAPAPAPAGAWEHNGRAYAKLAGVLVNSQVVGGEMRLIVGCGVNVTNAAPTTCLQTLVDDAGRRLGRALPRINEELLLGTFLATMEHLLAVLLAQGFAALQRLYRDAWVHSDQVVSLRPRRSDAARSEPGPEPYARSGSGSGSDGDDQVRIVGVTSDYGLLRTVPVTSPLRSDDSACWGRGGGFVDLMPDGNSFDMLQGLIRPKQ